MPRGVYFSFHYDDVVGFRVNVVRNSRALKNLGDEATFIDRSLWEEAKKKSPAALKTVINDGMKGSGVTALLIGPKTYQRRWVRYEIVKSFVEGKGIVPIHINRIKGRDQKIVAKGKNPLDYLKLTISEDGLEVSFFQLKGRKWVQFLDLPSINNRQRNSFHFQDTGMWFWKKTHRGKSYKFSDLFMNPVCWINNDGYNKFPLWIESAANQVGR
jgi:hypothetical protein